MATKAKTKKAKAEAQTEAPIVAYKGFNADMTCRGFQYEIGKTYDNGGKPVVRCGEGAFHSCGMPLDVFTYYGPVGSKFAVVEPAGDIARDADGDSKIGSGILSIKVDVSIGDLTRRAVAWVAEKALAQGNGQYAAGDGGHASAAGDYGHASAAGDYGHASAAGDGGHASAAGYRGHASAAGNGGHASVKGKDAIAHAPGIGGTATAHEGGAISLSAYDDDRNLIAVRSSLVGQNGIESGKTYCLTTAGEFKEV